MLLSSRVRRRAQEIGIYLGCCTYRNCATFRC